MYMVHSWVILKAGQLQTQTQIPRQVPRPINIQSLNPPEDFFAWLNLSAGHKATESVSFFSFRSVEIFYIFYSLQAISHLFPFFFKSFLKSQVHRVSPLQSMVMDFQGPGYLYIPSNKYMDAAVSEAELFQQSTVVQACTHGSWLLIYPHKQTWQQHQRSVHAKKRRESGTVKEW